MTGILGQAQAYASAGWPVFPVLAGCKKPPLTDHGFKDATVDLAVIRRWWRRWPDANVAIATGAPGPDVLDVDVKPDGSGFAAFNRLKQAGMLSGAGALVRTPSGGLHAYYAGSSQSSGRLPRHFLDFKAAGGYVLAPPSVVNGKPYELADHRVGADGHLNWQAATRLLEPPVPPARPRGRDGGDLGRLVAWVEALREGNRNDGLFWAACRAIEAGHGDLDALVAAGIVAGLTEPEASRTVASATRKAAAR